MCKNAVRCLEIARDVRDEFSRLHFDAISPISCIKRLFGDISYHLAHIFIKLYHINPVQYRSTLHHSKIEILKALEFYKQLDVNKDGRGDETTVAWLQLHDEIYQMSSVDKRSDSKRYRIRLAYTLQAVCAREAHDDSLVHNALENIKSLYKGPIENPQKEMEEANNLVEISAKIRKHDDASLDTIRQMSMTQENLISTTTAEDSQDSSALEKVKKVAIFLSGAAPRTPQV